MRTSGEEQPYKVFRGGNNTHHQTEKRELLRKTSDTLRYFTSSLPKAWAPDSVFWQYWKKLCKCWSCRDKRRKENESLLAYLCGHRGICFCSMRVLFRLWNIIKNKIKQKTSKVLQQKWKIYCENCYLYYPFISLHESTTYVLSFFTKRLTEWKYIYVTYQLWFCSANKIMQIHSQSRHC